MELYREHKLIAKEAILIAANGKEECIIIATGLDDDDKSVAYKICLTLADVVECAQELDLIPAARY